MKQRYKWFNDIRRRRGNNYAGSYQGLLTTTAVALGDLLALLREEVQKTHSLQRGGLKLVQPLVVKDLRK